MNMMDFNTYFELLNLYSDYAMVCDSTEWEKWPDFFTEDAFYRLQPRENFEQGMPLCLLALESKAMIKDRVYGVKETLYHDPYYQRHVVGAPLIRKTGEGRYACEASYAVFRTKLSQLTTVFNVGRTLDEIVQTEHGLRFQSRLVIYDSELIPNSLIYPI